MGAFSRRLDKGVTGEPCSPLQISVFNAVPAAFPADRTASGFPVRFHAPDALSNRESTGLLRFSTSVSTACGKLKERKNPISAGSFASPENLRCGICCGGLWNEISTTCAKYDTMRQGFPRNSPQTFPFHSTIFPLFHAEKTSPLFRILSTNVLWGKSPRNFRQKAGFPLFRGLY